MKKKKRNVATDQSQKTLQTREKDWNNTVEHTATTHKSNCACTRVQATQQEQEQAGKHSRWRQHIDKSRQKKHTQEQPRHTNKRTDKLHPDRQLARRE